MNKRVDLTRIKILFKKTSIDWVVETIDCSRRCFWWKVGKGFSNLRKKSKATKSPNFRMFSQCFLKKVFLMFQKNSGENDLEVVKNNTFFKTFDMFCDFLFKNIKTYRLGTDINTVQQQSNYVLSVLLNWDKLLWKWDKNEQKIQIIHFKFLCIFFVKSLPWA